MDSQMTWWSFVIVFSTLSKHPFDYTLLVFLIWPETVDFWAFYDPETKRNESFSFQRRHCEGSLHFNAGPVKDTCAECQTDSVAPALNQCGLVQLGFLAVFFLFWSLFLLPLTSIGTTSETPFLCLYSASFLYKNTVSVFMCLWHHLQFSFAWAK